jgi:L-ascorbate metabolism protein UlaG (beta-lactamase superfamily)
VKITHYLYNTFIIESGNKKIAIDPGGLMFYFFRFTTVIPKSEWESITHIFVTHGDPDHYWHVDRVAKVSNAPVICNKTMVRNIRGRTLMLGPRDKGLAFTTPMEKLHLISVDESIQLDGMSITGIKATHGAVTLKVGPLSKTLKPGPDERVGWGAIGFNIQLDGKSVANLGDTLLHEKEWKNIKNPDVLMIPIGGRTVHNTMDEKEAIQAVKIMQPKLVIPCHYNCPALFSKKYNPADDKMFKKEIEKMGIECVILQKGDSIEI